MQSLATRGLIRDADLKWVYLGCIIPDLPWILNRVARVVTPEISPYDIRLYAIVQTSLFMCLLLSGALAGLAERPRRVFAILALGSLLHLLLDASQTKWGSGVHLFAPFSWEPLNFGLFWPENPVTHVMTVLGLAVFIYWWWRIPPAPLDLVLPSVRRLALIGLALLAYVGLPLVLLSEPEAIDNHSVRTLRQTEDRPGRPVAFDRNTYRTGDGGYLLTFAGERLRVEGVTPDRAGTVSLRGRFLDPQTVQILELHQHWPLARDLAGTTGLALVLLYWVRVLLPHAWRRVRHRAKS